jgi:hypothetical protein
MFVPSSSTNLRNDLTQSTAIGENDSSMTSGAGGGMDKALAMLMEDTRYFRIGDKNHEFHDRDPIFTLDKPTYRRENLLATNAACTSCEVSFKSNKSVSYW